MSKQQAIPGFESTISPGTKAWFAMSTTDEWYTPEWVLAAVIAVLGDIDLDPCSDPGHNVPARAHYTEADDGLAQEWRGRVFLNPPYKGRQISTWLSKLSRELRAGRVTEVITLTPARTDTSWFRHYLWHGAALCFVYGRIQFIGPGSSGATFPSVLAYFGPNSARFGDIFSKHGQVVYPGVTK